MTDQEAKIDALDTQIAEKQDTLTAQQADVTAATGIVAALMAAVLALFGRKKKDAE